MTPSEQIAEKIVDLCCGADFATQSDLEKCITTIIDEARKEAVGEYQRSQIAEAKPHVR